MPWFHFEHDFLHRVTGSQFREYKAGTDAQITTACADAAIAAGRGYIAGKPHGVKISKSGEPVTSVFVTEEQELDDGEGSQPYSA